MPGRDDRPADTITKLVALATSPNAYEAESARDKAWKLVKEMDLELLATLAGQREALLHDLRVEHRRLISSGEKANKRTTGDLVGRALMLLSHYKRLDALAAIVALLQGKTPPEPTADFLTSWLGSRYRKDHADWEQYA